MFKAGIASPVYLFILSLPPTGYIGSAGFPSWPLFEDVGFLQMARKQTKIYTFPSYVTTSAEKFIKKGILRQQIYNAWFLLQYLAGVSPETLYRRYQT